MNKPLLLMWRSFAKRPMEIAPSPSLAATCKAQPTMVSRVFLPLAGPPRAGLFLACLPKQPSDAALFLAILARTFVFIGGKSEKPFLFRNALPACPLYSGFPLGSFLPGPLYGSQAHVVTLRHPFLCMGQLDPQPI